MRQLAQKLEALYQSSAHVTGSGTTALYLAIRALGIRDGNIAIPANVCISVPLAVYFSGNTPVFIDIEKDTLGLCPESLEKCREKFGAVVAVHSYGNLCKIHEIKAFCLKNSLPCIEDCALSQGILEQGNGRGPGIQGDIAILSFGAGKIVDADHGGAVLARDSHLLKDVNRVGEECGTWTRSKQQKIDGLSHFHTGLYNRQYLTRNWSDCAAFWDAARELKNDFLHGLCPDFEPAICKKLDAIEDNIERRGQRAQRIRKNLENRPPHLSIHESSTPSALWRLTVFVESFRNELFRQLLRKKYKISTWHPSVDIFFRKREIGDGAFPVSDWVGEHILNIWVNDEVEENYLDSISDEILRFEPA